MKLAVFDLDGVLYDGHTIFDIIRNQEEQGFIREGVWKQIEDYLVLYKSGGVSYEKAANLMLDVYLRSLSGKRYLDVKEYLKKNIESMEDKFYPYFEEILPNLKKIYDVYLLTTNLHATAEVVCERFGLKGFLSTEEEIERGKYTGKIKRSLAGNKHVVLELLEKYPFEGSFAVGDSVNDIPMLEKVENAICINPDKYLAKVAKQREWRIVDENSVEDVILSLI